MKLNKDLLITFSIIIITSLGLFATDIYLPSLPAIAAYFDVGDNAVQLTLFSYMVSFSIVPLFCGPLSDHFGRKKVMIPGLLIAMTGTLLCILSQSIEMMIAFRFIQGLGAAMAMIAGRAMLPDYFRGKALVKQISHMTMLMPLILGLAPALGGLIQEHFGWQAVFFFLFIYMVAVLALVVSMPESLKSLRTAPISKVFAGYRALMKNSSFLLYAMGVAYASVALFAYVTVSPFLFQSIIGLSPAEYGFLGVYIALVIITTSFVNSRVVNRFSVSVMQWLGVALMGVAGTMLLSFHYAGILTVWSLLVPALMIFATIPLSIGNSVSAAMHTIEGNFGASSGLLGTLQFVASSLGALVFSMIKDKDVFALACCFLLMAALSGVTLFAAQKQEKRHC